jgi:hypothetical protein
MTTPLADRTTDVDHVCQIVGRLYWFQHCINARPSAALSTHTCRSLAIQLLVILA